MKLTLWIGEINNGDDFFAVSYLAYYIKDILWIKKYCVTTLG